MGTELPARPTLVLILVLALGGVGPLGLGAEGWAAVSPADRPAAERFLAEAKVVRRKTLPTGVTRSERATLTDGERTADAIFKIIDVYRPAQFFADGGMPELGFRDSYKHEIAAYELDKLLGLDLVPPTVERRIRGKRGSLQLWLEEVITESERRRRQLRPPDREAWDRQVHKVRLFHRLTDNSDYNNVGNLLIDGDFRIWLIDSSRAFRLGEELLAEEDLYRFSRALLERLRDLSPALLHERLGRWLTKAQLAALLERRDALLERAAGLVEERGEEEVLYP